MTRMARRGCRVVRQRPGVTPAPTLTLYFTAHNSARLTAGRLADHLARQGDHAGETLDDYLTANYSRAGRGRGADVRRR